MLLSCKGLLRFRGPRVAGLPLKLALIGLGVTDSTGIRFRHISAPEKKFIVESMSGGVALFDYDNDNFLDIYFTNSLTVETVSNPHSSQSALYHNEGDGTFKDVTDGSGVGFPGWAMGVVAADYDGDGFEDLYITCLGPNVQRGGFLFGRSRRGGRAGARLDGHCCRRLPA